MLPLLALEAEHIELVLPVWAFPAIAAGVFLLLFFVSWSYRDVAHRHIDKVSAHSGSGDSQDAHH